MKSNFLKYFKQVMKQTVNDTIDGDFWYEKTKPIIKQSIYFRTIKILNQYVEDPDLTPVPREIFYYILPKLRTKINNIIKISFKEIYNLLSNYVYQYSEEFKENLLKLHNYNNGNLYIAILDNDKQILHSYLDSIFGYNKIEILSNKFLKNTSGITDSWSKDLFKDKIFNRDIVIILNKNLINKNQEWKDSLEHELTHVIQRIVGLNKSLKTSQQYLGTAFLTQFEKKINNLISDILNYTKHNKNEVKDSLYRFINYLIKDIEQHPLLKTCLNSIQRLYEQSQLVILNNNKFKYNWKKLENRQVWLQKFLNELQINSNFINLFDNYFLLNKSNLNIIQRLNYNKMMCVLSCLIYKCLGYNIEEKLQTHFNTFKLRDF